MIDVLQLILFGIVYGSIVTLGAVGATLTFGILRFANFAHGDLLTVGAYIAFTMFVTLQLPWALAVVVAAAGTAAVAVIADQIIFKRLRRAQPVILLVAAFGIAIILRSLVQLVWGTQTHVYESGIQMPIVFLDLRLKPDHIRIILGAVLLVTGLHLFLQRTKIGKAMRAMADSIDLSRITGIDTERVVLWTWVIGGVMAAAAGVFYGMDTRLHTEMGWRLLLPIFAATILGGIGKPYGAIVGGMVVGISEELSTLWILPTYKSAVSFGILVLLLIFRPTGLFSGR